MLILLSLQRRSSGIMYKFTFQKNVPHGENVWNSWLWQLEIVHSETKLKVWTLLSAYIPSVYQRRNYTRNLYLAKNQKHYDIVIQVLWMLMPEGTSSGDLVESLRKMNKFEIICFRRVRNKVFSFLLLNLKVLVIEPYVYNSINICWLMERLPSFTRLVVAQA